MQFFLMNFQNVSSKLTDSSVVSDQKGVKYKQQC